MNKKNKKGSIDVLITIILLFIVVGGIIFSVYIGNKLNAIFNEKLDDENAKSVMNEGITNINKMVDWVGLALFFIVLLGVIITSFLVFNHPVFIIIYFVLLLIGIIVGAVISNTYEAIFINTNLNETAKNIMPKTTYIFQNYPYFVLFVFIISMIIIYSKGKAEGII